MTGPEHYEAAQQLLRGSAHTKSAGSFLELVSEAQVHATLAVAAAVIDAANALAEGKRVDDEWAVVGTSDDA